MNLLHLFEKASKSDKKTLYCHRVLTNADKLVDWAKKQGFKSCLEPKKMHATIAYSKKKIDWSDMTDSFDTVKATGGKREMKAFGDEGKAIVLTFECKELHDRWKEFKDDFGASWDFDDYTPHISITYDGLPKDLKLGDIKPYKGPLEFGPEIMEEVDNDWKPKNKKLSEQIVNKFIIKEQFRIDDVTDLDSFYQTFKKSYEDQTGSAWSEDKLLSRARNWTFYGDEQGFVAVRVQGSGMKKLVAVAGNPRSIAKGLGELEASGGPIWGAVSAPLAMMAKKRGMIVPNLIPGGALFIKALAKTIPSSVWGGYEPKVTKDGGLLFSFDDVGTTTKYVIGNRAYFEAMVKLPNVADAIKRVPGLGSFLKALGFSQSR